MGQQEEQAGWVLSGIGSLSVARLRLAGGEDLTALKGDLEIRERLGRSRQLPGFQMCVLTAGNVRDLGGSRKAKLAFGNSHAAAPSQPTPLPWTAGTGI